MRAIPLADPLKLAEELGVLAAFTNTNGSGPAPAPPPPAQPAEPPKPVDMSHYSWIQEVLDEPYPDRSTHIYHVVRECYRAGLESVAEAHWVVNQRADLVAKLAKLKHDDVQRNWDKIRDEWPNRQIRAAARIAAIVADVEAGKYADPPEDTTWEPMDLGRGSTALRSCPSGRWEWSAPNGLRLVYPGREHAILGETETGKTWIWRWAASPPNSSPTISSSTSTTRRAIPPAPSNGCRLLGVDPHDRQAAAVRRAQ